MYNALSYATPEEAVSNFDYSILIDTGLHSPEITKSMYLAINKVIQFANIDRLKLITLSCKEEIVYTYTLIK